VYLFLAILLLSCAQFGSQILMPALPGVAASFGLEDSIAQQVIMVYFIGFGLSQLIYGPWSDSAGRRKVFLVGQGLYVLGTLLCVLAPSEWYLALGRFIQGIGAGAPLIVSRTLLSDHFTGELRKKAMASLAIAASFISVLAPVLGGTLTSAVGWQSLFALLGLYLLLSGLIGWYLLPRQVQHRRSQHGQIQDSQIKQTKATPVKGIVGQYRLLLLDRRFLMPALFKWLPSLLYLTSATLLPFILQHKLDLSAQQYGMAMMLPATGLILGTCLAKLLHAQLSYPSQLLLFLPLLFLAGAGFILLPFTLTNCLLSYSLFMVCGGAFYTISLHLLIEPFEQQTGSVNALCGAIDMLVFSVLAMLINHYWVDTLAKLGWLYLVVSSALLLVGLALKSKSGSEPAFDVKSMT
jgi:MFS transporter, DHA1 family, 2-module integral membrane pump EmrD